ncbi:MAG: dCTP deaminase [Candidatus Bathyarchaeia archaeon]|jgi:dCTP deaminase
MAILSRTEIQHLIYEAPIDERLCITPLTDPKNQIGEGTVDIRLGSHFIIYKGRKIETVDPTEENIPYKIREFQEKIYIPYGKKFMLHPNEFILGGSLEYLRFPSNIIGYVVGRSSWGRLGLIIETSPIIHACFTGILTFELSNLSTAPIALYPGTRIAQIVVHEIEGECTSCKIKLAESRYNLNTSPEFSKIYRDKELKKIRSVFNDE